MNKDRRWREEEDKEKDQRDWILAGRDLPAKQWAVYRMVRYRGLSHEEAIVFSAQFCSL